MKPSIDTWRLGGVWGAIIFCVTFWVILAMVGCGDVRIGGEAPKLPAITTPGIPHPYNPTPPPGAPPGAALVGDALSSGAYHQQALDLQKEIAAAKAEIVHQQGIVATKEAEKATALADERAARHREIVGYIQTVLCWLGGIVAVLGLAAVALSIWTDAIPLLSILPKTLRRVALGCGAVAALCFVLAYLAGFVLTLFAILKWTLIVGGILALPVAGYAFYLWLRSTHAWLQIAKTGDQALETLKVISPTSHDVILSDAVARQTALGVQGQVNRLLDHVRAAGVTVAAAIQEKANG